MCATHPNTETLLRCNRCEKPICAKCSVLTPTGYRCKTCVSGQQKAFETAETRDFFVAIAIGGVLAFLGSLLVTYVGFFTIFLAPGAGTLIAEIIRRAVSRRRSKRLFQFAAGAVAIGSLLPLCVFLFGFVLLIAFPEGDTPFFGLAPSLLWQGVYTFFVTSTVYARLSGLTFR